MRHVKFKMVMDLEYRGEIGVLPNIHRNWSNYIPSIPQDLGHDLLEHGTRETGAFDEECAALGGFLFVRNFGAYRLSLAYSFEQVVAMDLVGSVINCQRGGEVRKPSKVKLDSFDDDRINDLMTNARPKAIDRWVSEYGSDFDEDYTEENPFQNNETWARITGWVKLGYARAHKRFKGEQGTAYALYLSVIREFKKHWSTLLTYGDTGVEFSIALDYDNGVARMNYSPWL